MYQPWMTEVTGKFVLREIAFLTLLRHGVIKLKFSYDKKHREMRGRS